MKPAPTPSPPASPEAESSIRPVRSRVYYFDYLRLWATLGVIMLHTSALIFTVNHKKTVDLTSKFSVADLGDSLGRFGVGCFFMVSGALLLAPEHTFRLRKQVVRVAAPLVFWSVVYALFEAYFKDHHLPRISGTDTHPTDVVEVVKSFFRGAFMYHLWFVYVLVGIYLVMPLLRPLTALPTPRRDALLRYGLLLWVIFTLVLPAAEQIWPKDVSLYHSAFPPLPIGYLGTVVLGFYLHHHGITFRGRPIRRTALLVGAFAGMITGAISIYLELTLRHGSGWGLNNLTPQITLYAACVFLLAKSTFDRPGRHYAFVSLFSRLSYRIYLMHALVLHYLRAISPMKHWYLDDPLLSIPVITVLTVVITFLLAWAIDQIKPLRNYI